MTKKCPHYVKLPQREMGSKGKAVFEEESLESSGCQQGSHRNPKQHEEPDVQLAEKDRETPVPNSGQWGAPRCWGEEVRSNQQLLSWNQTNSTPAGASHCPHGLGELAGLRTTALLQAVSSHCPLFPEPVSYS